MEEIVGLSKDDVAQKPREGQIRRDKVQWTAMSISFKREELYVLADGGDIAACVIANAEKVDGYSDAPWQIDSDEVIVLHVLAVHPDHRGKGLARRLVENVIEQERKVGKKALRLDVIENNTTAEKLYQKLGFQYIQTKTLYYDVVGEMTFKLYELVL